MGKGKLVMRSLGLVLVLMLLGGSAYAVTSLVPVIANAGFDDDAGGWSWSVNGAKATCREVAANPHSGKRCMAFVNESGVGPNCYARLFQKVVVVPETDYELSVWVRGNDVSGEGGASHFTDWSTYSLNLPSGTFDWRRVTTTFKTKPGQGLIDLGINVINKCKELAIDDVSLRPIGAALKGIDVEGSFSSTKQVIDHDSTGNVAIFVSNSRIARTEVLATISAAGKDVYKKRAILKAGDNTFEWEWNSGKAPFGDLVCTVRVLDGDKTVASGESKITKVQSAFSPELDRIEARMREFNELYKKCQAKKIPLDYPTVAKTMLDQFIPMARQDARDGVDWRAQGAVKDFNRTLDNSIADMKAYLADPTLAPIARRYQTSKVTIDGLSLIGDRLTTDGKRDRGPVFLTGYGHFSRLRFDMPKWPSYGINMIQFGEFGPSAIFPKEGEVDLAMAKVLVKTLDEAAKRNVRVDFLLSPHYFPGWAMQKWPEMTCGWGGFFGFFVDDPHAKDIIEKFLRIVIPMIKDKPALNSFCLSNEPNLEGTGGCEITKQQWAAYLAKTYGDVKTMNERYGSSYAAFSEVPIMGNQAFNEPQYYDYCYFNDLRYAAWHKWEGDICRELAPNIPVHAKIQMHNTLFRDMISHGVSPEMFGEVSDYNGNDCIFVDNPGEGWSAPFNVQNVCYDIQRSLNVKPIFNSENHPSLDGDTRYTAPDHYRTGLWLGALRGQSVTTYWVWERMSPGNAGSYAFVGNVMDHPGCAEALGVTNLDLNRFADEMQALQHVKSPAAILFSVASIAKQGEYLGNLRAAYSALNFCGIKVDFISEKQLAEGKGAQYKMIVMPEAANVLDATFDAIKALPESVRLVCIGDCLSKDQYNHARPQADVDAIRSRSLVMKSWPDLETVLWPTLWAELDKLGGLPNVRMVDAATGNPVWGVEWLPAKIGNRTVISMIDLRTEPKNVKVQVGGETVDAKDLLSLGGRESVKTLKPNTPVLAEVKQ